MGLSGCGYLAVSGCLVLVSQIQYPLQNPFSGFIIPVGGIRKFLGIAGMDINTTSDEYHSQVIPQPSDEPVADRASSGGVVG